MTSSHQPLNLMRLIPLYFGLSLAVVIPGIMALLLFGFKPSIDFTGGTLVELAFNTPTTPDSETIKSAYPENVAVMAVQPTSDNGVVVRSQSITKDQNELIKEKLASVAASLLPPDATQSATASGLVTERRFETVGPILGKELLRKTYTAAFLAAGSILLYIAYRFKQIKYGVCAVLAMLHDTLILLGTFAILGKYAGIEVDTLFVTAVLTTLSFSVHDTIVVYDRIRELTKKYHKIPYATLVNKAVIETLSRSVNNSMTIIFMLLALWLMGGETTKWFVFALLIGTITGTYSSTFTAAPLLILWDKLMSKKAGKK